MELDARAKTVLSVLSRVYPKATIALSYQSPWELLVAVILSAQCTDVVVNKVTAKLFGAYPTLDSYCGAELVTFEQHIKPTGFYHNKAKNILAAAQKVQKDFHGNVPNTMSDLLTLPGVARKTANVVLGNAYGIVEGIAVDTHVLRLSQRLRLVPIEKIGGKKRVFVNTPHAHCPTSPVVDYVKDASPEKIEAELMKTLPKQIWFTITYRLIDHGRAVCKAQNPKCGVCPLAPCCPTKR